MEHIVKIVNTFPLAIFTIFIVIAKKAFLEKSQGEGQIDPSPAFLGLRYKVIDFKRVINVVQKQLPIYL